MMAARVPDDIVYPMLYVLREAFLWRMLVDDWHELLPVSDHRRTRTKGHRDITTILGRTGQVLHTAFKAEIPQDDQEWFDIDEIVDDARRKAGLTSYVACLDAAISACS